MLIAVVLCLYHLVLLSVISFRSYQREHKVYW